MNLELDLDFHDIGGWPNGAKAVAVALICVVTLFLGYWFDTQHQIEDLDQKRTEEAALKDEYGRKYAKAANLVAYIKQMAEMKQSFGTMLKQLPSKTEVADLLVDISQTGLASGLEFQLFKPSPENPIDFYAELPISIRVSGNFHELGEFVSGVAALPRIVTLHDFSIRPKNAKGSTAELSMDATLKTYRYLDESETQPTASK